MPKIINKTYEELLEESRALALAYAPDWKPQSSEDPGLALLKIFNHMREEIIVRLNKVPDKGLGAFLNMLGIKLIPASPARVPVTFYPADGLKGSVFVTERTQVASQRVEGRESLVYETIKGFTVSTADLIEVFSVDPDKDAIYRHTEEFKAGKEFRIFRGELGLNIQRHEMYFGNDRLFKIKGGTPITLKFSFLGNVGQGDIERLTWKYYGEQGEVAFDNPSVEKGAETSKWSITLTPQEALKESKVNGINSIWICCSLGKIDGWPKDACIIGIEADVGGKEIKPDMGFSNFIPLDLSSASEDAKIYPFGPEPKLFDAFYIASREAFSKKGAEVVIRFTQSNKNCDPKEKELSWEYWNGHSWKVLSLQKLPREDLPKFTACFDGSISFVVPEDLQESDVGGERNYWIRVRLISGSYGSYKVEKDDTANSIGWKITPSFQPPIIESVDISYSTPKEMTFIQHCICYNNLRYNDFTDNTSNGSSFKPFIPLFDSYPTVYLGFNDAFGKGNASLFLSMIEKPSLSLEVPNIAWYYWSSGPSIESIRVVGEISELNLVTAKGIRVGMDLLIEEPYGRGDALEQATVSSYNSKKISLKTKLDHAFIVSSRLLKKNRLDVIDGTEHLCRSGTLEFIAPQGHQANELFGVKCFWILGTPGKPVQDHESPVIRGIYPNTIWADQVETFSDEILGSSEGERNSTYNFLRRPAINPEFWVKEGMIIAESELDRLLAEAHRIQEVKDDTGKTVEAWVLWKAVDDFFSSGPRSRHYILDEAMGTVTFGDGEKGMIPPIGRDNIRASYRSGGGVGGNVAKGEISTIKTPIAGIDRVINNEPAEGGSDAESISSALERGPHVVRHRDRAVTPEDFERLSKSASSYIARVKSYVECEKLNVVVIPRGYEEKPSPSSGLLRIVEETLLEKSLNTLSRERLAVKGPTYKEVAITATVVSRYLDSAAMLERKISDRLKEYLHPLTGGPEGSGWEFGRDVHLSDVYSLLEGIEGVDHVESLHLNDKMEDVIVAEHETVCSGDHLLSVKIEA